MRNVIITREKSGVASLVRMKVYIEDSISGDVPIKMKVRDEATGLPVTQKVMCRQLGTLKNGEQATFPIGWGAAKIVVISDKLSKNYCNEYYQIPAGEEDVVLSGKNKYHPLAGNPFRFNGTTDDMVIKNRKRSTKIGIAFFALSLLIGLAISLGMVGYRKNTPKTFSNEGISITLTGEFSKVDFEDYTVCYGSKDVAVFTLEEKFSLMPGASLLNLNQYAHMVMNSSEVDSTIETKNGLTYFEYEGTDPDTGEIYAYYVFMYKETDAFWIVQFGMDLAKKAKYSEKVFEWAANVQFN